MKQNLFVEPELALTRFAPCDSTLFISGYETGDPDELDSVSGAYANTPALV